MYIKCFLNNVKISQFYYVIFPSQFFLVTSCLDNMLFRGCKIPVWHLCVIYLNFVVNVLAEKGACLSSLSGSIKSSQKYSDLKISKPIISSSLTSG